MSSQRCLAPAPSSQDHKPHIKTPVTDSSRSERPPTYFWTGIYLLIRKF